MHNKPNFANPLFALEAAYLQDSFYVYFIGSKNFVSVLNLHNWVKKKQYQQNSDFLNS